MFPLTGKAFPTSSDELAASIKEALAEVFTLSGKSSGVSIAGGKFPSLKTVKIDLDDATVSASEPPPKPKATGKREAGVSVEKLEVSARPINYEGTKLDLKVSGSGLRFDFGRDKKGRPLLVLTEAADGKVEAKIDREDVRELLLAGATAAGKQQGITIQDLELELTSNGPRSVAADVRVKAKKLMMSGVIRIRGQLDIDDELNATVSGLTCTGEGVVGSAASGIVQKKLAPYEGMEVPLMAFSLGDVALRDLKIAVKESVRVTAAFGKEA